MKRFCIAHPLGFAVDQNFDESAAIKYASLTSRTSNGYSWYGLPAVKNAPFTIGISLCFHATKLTHIRANALGDEFGESWDDWTEEKEKRRARRTEKWLKTIGLNLGVYSWGTVHCGFDVRSGSGGAEIWLFINQRFFLGAELSMLEFSTLRQLLINVLGTWESGYVEVLGFSQSTCDAVYQEFPEAKDAAQSLNVAQTILRYVLTKDDMHAKRWLSNNINMSSRALKAMLTKVSGP